MRWFLIAAFLTAFIFSYAILAEPDGGGANIFRAMGAAIGLTAIGWLVARKADARWGAATMAGLMFLMWMGQ